MTDQQARDIYEWYRKASRAMMVFNQRIAMSKRSLTYGLTLIEKEQYIKLDSMLVYCIAVIDDNAEYF